MLCDSALVVVRAVMLANARSDVLYLHSAISSVVTERVTTEPDADALIAVTTGLVVSVTVNWFLT
jgi:hypothetical protein